MGASRSAWGGIVPAVAERTRCVVYDRAGIGRSPRADGPRNLSHLADDLIDLLEHLGSRPAIVVGHSWGGPIARLATARRPDLVAGLVLIDQSDERCDLFFDKAAMRQQDLAARLLPFLARTGLLRLQIKAAYNQLPESDLAAMLTEDTTVAAARALQAELADLDGDLRSLLADPPDLGARPVTWISGTKPVRLGRKNREALIAAHRASAAAHPGGRHVEATRSAHLVMNTEPALVIAEVLRIVDQVDGTDDP